MEYITRGCFFVFCNLLLYEIGAQMRGEKKVGQFKKIVRGITAGLMSAAVLMSGMVSTDIGPGQCGWTQ